MSLYSILYSIISMNICTTLKSSADVDGVLQSGKAHKYLKNCRAAGIEIIFMMLISTWFVASFQIYPFPQYVCVMCLVRVLEWCTITILEWFVSLVWRKDPTIMTWSVV